MANESDGHSRAKRLLYDFGQCPYCRTQMNIPIGSYEKSLFSVDFEDTKVLLFMQCPNPECETTWTETYELIHVDFDQEDERIPIRNGKIA